MPVANTAYNNDNKVKRRNLPFERNNKLLWIKEHF